MVLIKTFEDDQEIDVAEVRELLDESDYKGVSENPGETHDTCGPEWFRQGFGKDVV